MNRKVFSAIKQYSMLEPGDSVIIACSGGADSTALLDFFCKNRRQLSLSAVLAVHVNHLLRGEEALRDEEFVRRLCAAEGIQCLVERRDIRKLASLSGESLETCGRRVRYEILENIAQKYRAKIATAHTLGDNAETILFRMARGTGHKGLCGIPPVRGRIIRPLIFCTRQEIEGYLAEQGLTYCTDSSNLELEFARNQIRQVVIPALEQINQAVQVNLARMSGQLREEEDFLETLCLKQIKQMQTPLGYDCRNFSTLHPALQRRVIFSLAGKRVPSVDEKRVGLICRALETGQGKIRLDGDFYANISHFLLTFEKKTEPNQEEWQIPLKQLLDGRGQASVSVTVIEKENWENFKKIHKNLLKSALDYDRIIGNAVLRHKRPGDSIRLADRKMTKTLKKLFSEYKIPIQIRERLTVLSDEQGVIWVEGFGCDERVAPTGRTKRALCFTDTIQESG